MQRLCLERVLRDENQGNVAPNIIQPRLETGRSRLVSDSGRLVRIPDEAEKTIGGEARFIRAVSCHHDNASENYISKGVV